MMKTTRYINEIMIRDLDRGLHDHWGDQNFQVYLEDIMNRLGYHSHDLEKRYHDQVLLIHTITE
jgi:hypothetical protein